ncbi:FxsC protein [Catellatospora aurea]|uniref:FxsC protein n=1 Tax=Catellatospora aurea TaxID=1337874 RepID=A0ABW2GVV9_9ACTN
MAAVAVFVHGLFSSARTWDTLEALFLADPDPIDVKRLPWNYPSPPVGRPLESIPSFNTLADSLWTFLETETDAEDRVCLVTHSQGGLIAQRLIVRMLKDGRGSEIQRIRSLVMFACPNDGSEFHLTLRRGFFRRHPQVQDLKPFHQEVQDTRHDLINRAVHATVVSESRCPITVWAYAGQTDRVVTPESAQSAFPKENVGVLPGTHSKIIRPKSPDELIYKKLRQHFQQLRASHSSLRIPAQRSETSSGQPPPTAPPADGPPVSASGPSPRPDGDPPTDAFLVHIVVAAGTTEEIRAIWPRRADQYYGTSHDLWAPYMHEPTQEEPDYSGRLPLAYHAGVVATVRDFKYRIADVAQLQHLTTWAEENNQFIILLVDVWSTFMPEFASIVHRYDVRATGSEPQRNDPVVVPWSRYDPSFSIDGRLFWERVSANLPHALERGDPDLLILASETPDEFKRRLAKALTVAKTRLFTTGRVFQEPPGPPPPSMPILGNP